MVKMTILKALPPKKHNAERTEAVRILGTLLLFGSLSFEGSQWRDSFEDTVESG